MKADLKGALAQLNTSYKAFQHKGRYMTKSEVKTVLEYGIAKGYTSTADFTDDEVDRVLGLRGDVAPTPVKTAS